MATINSWDNQILAANVTFNGGTMSLGTDSTDNAINIGTAASAGRTVTIGNATGTSTIAVNCGTGGITIGTSANAHSSTLGSTNSTSATTIQSGSGALNVTATGGALTINSGTGALSISNDASATTVTIATGGAAKTVTLGSTNTTSSLVLSSGSGNIAANTGLTVDSTGRTTNTKQPAFYAFKSSNSTNQMGGGAVPTIIFDTVVTNNGSSYNNSTGIFTAPIAGMYQFNANCWISNVVAGNSAYIDLVLTSRAVHGPISSPLAGASSGTYGFSIASCVQMAANDTARIKITSSGEAGNTQTIRGDAAPDNETSFSGFLVC